MSASSLKTGPLTRAEFLDLWKASVDDSYSEPIVAAGEGQGLEAFTQNHVQLERVSEAAEVSTQALYIRPWSGQTRPSAQGAARATVTITAARDSARTFTLILTAGQTFFEESTIDPTPDGGEVVLTGRRYTPTVDLVFQPGELGPLDVATIAEQVGYGYNNPRPGSLKVISQPGTSLNNIDASMLVTAFSTEAAPIPYRATIACLNEPDVFLPDHVGQYVELTAGNADNKGIIARIVRYRTPGDPTVGDGGGVDIELIQSFLCVTPVGTFVVGETIKFLTGATSHGTGRLIAKKVITGGTKLTFSVVTMFAASYDNIVGVTSGATATKDFVYQATFPTAEVSSLQWRILDWVLDFGLTATNALSPVGGLAGTLDTLGRERGIDRAPGESDTSYVKRVSEIADVVSPNAVRRAVNRILAPLGSAVCLREVGDLDYLPGFFYDAGGSASGDDTHPADPHSADHRRNFAYDMDFDLRPADRFKLYLDYAEFRAFFLVGVPLYQLGEWGFFYDGTTADAFPMLNPYDTSSPTHCFYDGTTEGEKAIYRAIQATVEAAKAAGVGWAQYHEVISCP